MPPPQKKWETKVLFKQAKLYVLKDLVNLSTETLILFTDLQILILLPKLNSGMFLYVHNCQYVCSNKTR